jgi:LuxR family maltose regulon positive regulatory protein
MDHPSTLEEPRARRRSKFRRPLTERERDVLRYLPTRLSTVDIARGLHISPNTVKTHLKNIYEKLGAGSRNEAIIKAARLHLISDESAALVRPLADDAARLVSS